MGHRVSHAAVRVLVGVILLMSQMTAATTAAEPSNSVEAAPAASPTPSVEPASASEATFVHWQPHAHYAVRGIEDQFGVYVGPALVTGTVELRIDDVTVATEILAPGQGIVWLSWIPTTVGDHVAQAFYLGSPGFDPSATGAFPFVVVLPTPNVTFTVSDLEVPKDTDVTFSVTITPDPGPGFVEISIDDVVVDTGALAPGGTYSYTTSFATAGPRRARARFLGNENWGERYHDIYLGVLQDPVEISVSVPAIPMARGEATATVVVDPAPGGGTISWLERSRYYVGEVPLGPGGVTVLDLSMLPPGTYLLEVTFSGYGEYLDAHTEVEIEVREPASLALSANRSSIFVGELPVVLTATLTGVDDPNAAVSFWDTVGRITRRVGTATVDPTTNVAILTVSTFAVGSHSIAAVYPGTSAYMPARSNRVTVNAAADTAVHATFAPSLSTFYPYRDSVRDQVTLGGVLDETASVTIRAYNSAGSMKRSWSLGSKPAGSFSVNWNGRTSGGADLPAGKYKVRATITDKVGNTRTIDAYTTISWRKATWKSASVLRYADTGAYFSDTGGGLYASADYPRGRVLDSVTGGWIGGQFIFPVASGAVEYRKLYIEFRGHGFSDRDHPGTKAVIDPRTGEIGYESALYPYDQPGVTSGIPFGPEYISSTGKVEAWAFMEPEWNDAYDLNFLKFTYQYAVWL